jgi:hypothetical protein
MMEEMLRDREEKMGTWLAEKQDGQKEMTTCQEATEANPGKLKACQETTACHEVTKPETEGTERDPGIMQSIGEHQKVPKKAAAVMPVRGLRKRRRDRNLAVRRRQKPKGRIQASRESRKTLTVAGRKVTRRARVAWHKRGIARKDCTRANVVQEIWRGQMFGRRCLPKSKCSKSIRN